MRVRPKSLNDRHWIEAVLAERWGGPTIVVRGGAVDARLLPALVAGDREGLATYHVARRAELVTLDALTPGRGTGTALVSALADRLRARGVGVLRVTTTNDNLDALRFYQRRGFRLVRVRPGAVAGARRLKPSIPEVGAYGIPIRDEIDLVLDLR